MKLTAVTENICCFPDELHAFMQGATLYDSSCSAHARVLFIDKNPGYFLKIAASTKLRTEASLCDYFHLKGLAPEVLMYISSDKDYMLTRKIPGQDCTSEIYTSRPERLCDTLAESLAELHSLDHEGCPVPDHTERYLSAVRHNHAKGCGDPGQFGDGWGFNTAKEAYQIVEANAHLLKTDTLLHGDYCLPNIILNNWAFSGFVDLDSAGVGDKHVDLFWGTWTFRHNLGTDKHRSRFLDAYGRDKVDEEMLRVVAACEVFG